MKKIIFSVSVFLLSLLFLKQLPSVALANPQCITFKVKVKIVSGKYPGGTLQVGCPGDRGPECVGQIKEIRPGLADPVILGKCSCFPNDNGCLKLGKKLHLAPLVDGKRKVIIDEPIPQKCQITNENKICGGNGDVRKGIFKLACVAATPTPTEKLTPTLSPSPTPKPSVTPNPSQTPTPSICPVPKKVTNVKVTCPNCFASPTPTVAPEN